MQAEFSAAVRACLQKYIVFEGRAGRPEYWYWVLFTFLLGIAASIVDGIFPGPGFVQPLVGLATLLPGLAAGARRLHDTGKSGWYLLAGLIPILGWIFLIYLLVQPSEGPNQYGSGPEPLAVSR